MTRDKHSPLLFQQQMHFDLFKNVYMYTLTIVQQYFVKPGNPNCLK